MGDCFHILSPKGLQMVSSRGKNSAKTLHWRMVGYETYSALTNLRYDLGYLIIYHNLLASESTLIDQSLILVASMQHKYLRIQFPI